MRNALHALLLLVPMALGGCTVLVENRFAPAVADDAGSDGALDGNGTTDANLVDATMDAAGDTGPTPTCAEPCAGETPFCDEVAGRCAQCLENVHCPEANASRCESGACVGCAGNEDCGHVGGKPVCDRSECVGCTVETEASVCGDNSCDPATRTCTGTQRGSVANCQPCVADSECQGEHRCVDVAFGDSSLGGRCLRPSSTGPCTRPFSTVIRSSSRSSAPEDDYCHVTSLTTCEGLQDLIASKPCIADSDCGYPDLMDGLCRSGSGASMSCTYACGVSNHCPSGVTCNGAYCLP